jgi:hypothetical protein
MAGQEILQRARPGRMGTRTATMPEIPVRLVAALLALAVAAVHVADQGGITTLTTPAWIGWGYRLVEVGAVLTALALLLGRPAWLGWAAGVLLGAGPFVGYIASRTAGVPADPQDIGNWGDWDGTVALIVEARADHAEHRYAADPAAGPAGSPRPGLIGRFAAGPLDRGRDRLSP